MAFSTGAKLQELEAFLTELPQIKYATPSSSEYASLRETFTLNNKAVPLAITRPQNAEDVAKLVRYSVSNGIDITVRGGGHE